jgi:hypothetical protein
LASGELPITQPMPLDGGDAPLMPRPPRPLQQERQNSTGDGSGKWHCRQCFSAPLGTGTTSAVWPALPASECRTPSPSGHRFTMFRRPPATGNGFGHAGGVELAHVAASAWPWRWPPLGRQRLAVRLRIQPHGAVSLSWLHVSTRSVSGTDTLSFAGLHAAATWPPVCFGPQIGCLGIVQGGNLKTVKVNSFIPRQTLWYGDAVMHCREHGWQHPSRCAMASVE